MHEANVHSSVELTVVAREKTRKLVAEADLAAEGLIRSRRPGAEPLQHDIDGIVVSRIDVCKMEKHRGREGTIDSTNTLEAQNGGFYRQAGLHHARAYNQRLYATRDLESSSDAVKILERLIADEHYSG